MAIEYFDGFDGITGAQMARQYNQYVGGLVDQAGIGTPGRGGVGSCLFLEAAYGDHSEFIYPALTPRSEYFMGFDFLTGGETGINVFCFTNSSGTNLSPFLLSINSDNSLGTAFGNSAPGVFVANVWQTFYMHAVVSATVGVFEIQIDGVTVLNYTGVNTGTTDIGGYHFYCGTQRYDGTEYTSFDNVWVFNTSGSHSNAMPVGQMGVQPLYPTANGTYTDWTPLTGSNYSEVNETVADENTSYVSSLTVNDTDTYTIGSVTGTISQVHGCKVQAVIEKDAVPPKTFHTVLKSGSTVVEGSDVSVPTAYTPIATIYNDDPNTSAQWTTTNINAVEIGGKVIS